MLMTSLEPVLVVGATGHLGSKIVAALVAEGRQVRALVRPGTNPDHILQDGVEVVRGDLMDRASLDRALVGVDAVVSSAAGYNKRRRDDSAEIDKIGFRNLAEAVQSANTRRIVITGVLKSELAKDVSHFRDKQAQEDLLEVMGLPFVSIRPGSFLDQSRDFLSESIAKGKFVWLGSSEVPMSWITTEYVALLLAKAVDVPGIEGQRIEVGSDRNLSPKQLAQVIETIVERPVALRMPPWWLVRVALGIVGVFKKETRDFRANIAFFQTGKFIITDASPQEKAFGPPATVESLVRRWLEATEVLQGVKQPSSTAHIPATTNMAIGEGDASK